MRKRSILYLCLAALGVVVLIRVILLGYGVDWTGFQAYTEPQQSYHPPKTLWDWMGLLIVPLALGLVAFFLNRSEQTRQAKIARDRDEADRKLADERAQIDRQLADKRAETDRALALDHVQELRLQAYIVTMKELLLDYELRSSPPQAEVREVARTLTATVLRGLDDVRKRAVLLFLNYSGMLRNNNDGLLADVDLSGADLPEINLTAANLSYINLSGANLINANLSEAGLRGANLSRAWLAEANLSGADLSEAHLRGILLSDATYNDATKWPDGFDPVAAGAKKVGPEPPDDVNADESKPA